MQVCEIDTYLLPPSIGIRNSADKCPKLNATGDQVDDDGDGVGNLCDNCPNNHNSPPQVRYIFSTARYLKNMKKVTFHYSELS